MFIDLRERVKEGGKGGGGEKHPREREASIGDLLYMLQPGVEPTTFIWCAG